MPFFKRKADKDKKPPASPVPGAGGGGASRSRVSSTTSDASSTRDSASLDIPNGAAIVGGEDRTPYGWGERPRSLLLDPNFGAPGSDGLMMMNDPLKPQTPMITSSRLSKTFHEVLHDKDALPYFIQFMGSQNAEHIIKFWLDAESFQASSWTRIRSQSLKSQHRNTAKETGSTTSSPPEGVAAAEDSTECANCDKHRKGGENTKRNSCDNDKNGDSASIDGNVQETTSQGVINHGRTAEPAGQAANMPSNHSNPPETENVNSNQSDSSKHSAPLPIETTSSSISQSSQINQDAHSMRNSDQPKSADSTGSQPAATTAEGLSSSLRSQPSTSPGSSAVTSPREPQSSPTSPTADKPSNISFQEKLKKSIERDAVSIFSKYLSHDASHPIGITEELRNEVMTKICREDGEVDPQSFVSCQEFAERLMDVEFFSGFLSSEFHCKHQIDLLTTTSVHLADIIYNDQAMFYFSEFMEQESGSKLLQCFLAIHNFQEQLTEQYGSYDGSMAQSDAMVIYDKYFSLQATSPLGFSDDVRFEVEGNICREGGPLPDCFATAKRQVLRTIDKVYFPQFVTSDLYFKYLGELINTVQTQDLPGIRRKRTGSDASSEHSLGSHSTGSEKVTISAKNTLLASANQTVSHMRKAFNKVDDDMQIDSALFNPDELWKRPQAGKLSLGKINELGQFVSEVEPEPDVEKKKKGTFITKKKKEKEKTQEEMAQQIAQMIINDIASLNAASDFDLDLSTSAQGQERSTAQGQGHDTSEPQASSLLNMPLGGELFALSRSDRENSVTIRMLSTFS